MKKIFALMLAVVMLIAAAAFAEDIPSKDPSGMTGSTTDNVQAMIWTKDCEASEKELENLKQAESIAKYFENAQDFNGNPVVLTEMLEAEEAELNVDEFTGVFAKDFKNDCGDVTATLKFASPIEVGEKVAVMIGLSGNNGYDWTAFEGLGVNSTELGEGCIEVTLPQDMVLAIQHNSGLIAIISK